MLIDDSATLAKYKKNNRSLSSIYILLDGSTRVPDTQLVKFTIERDVPTGKFFGYTVSQKLTAEFLGKPAHMSVGSTLKVGFFETIGSSSGVKYFATLFYVESITYDEAKKTTTVVGHDFMGSRTGMVFSDSTITYPISLYDFTSKTASRYYATLSADFTGVNPTIEKSTLNLSGTETVREVLTAIAEATGTICYTLANGTKPVLVFRDVPKGTAEEAVDSFDGSNYFDFTTKDAVKLTKVASATELGDNLEVGTSGYTQIIRENPFLVLRSDISSLLYNIADKVRGIQIVPHTLNFRGNPYYEIGDLLAIDGLDGTTKYIHYLSGTFTYDGGINATSEWASGVSEQVDAAPTSIGDAIGQTYAKVDKANKRIDLVVSQVDEVSNQVDEKVSAVTETMSQISLQNDLISQTVQQNTQYVNSSINGLTESMSSLSQKVSQTITPEQMEIAIETKLQDTDIDEVTTVTGFTFNADGLTISKTGTEMSTNIDEDGMTVYRSGQQILVADSTGVDATNLHASTYLSIGKNSRFEDYNSSRTACFWIGG